MIGKAHRRGRQDQIVMLREGGKMENKQIFMFFADVVALAARHFGESPHAAPAEPRAPQGPNRSTTAATPPMGAREAEVEWDQDLMGRFASELSSVLDDDEDENSDDELTGVQRQTARSQHGRATFTRDDRAGRLDGAAAVNELVAELEKVSLQLAAERAANDRLHAILAQIQYALGMAQGHHTQKVVEVLKRVLETEVGLLAATKVEQGFHRPTTGEVLSRAELAQEHDSPAAAGHAGTAEHMLRAFAALLHCASATSRSGRGRDVEAELPIDFSQMVRGATMPLQVEVDGEPRAVEIAVPAGIADGTTLTLPAQGGAGDPPGDLLVRVRVIPDLTVSRDGNNITMRVPVPLEALARKKLSVEAPTGALTVSITPEHLGHTLRCKGKGIAPMDQEAGDLLIALDPSPILAASLDQFPSPAVAFSALRSLCSSARAHLADLVEWARHSSDRRDIREVLWALAIAHERGLRKPIHGFAAGLVADLVKHGSLRPPESWRNRRSHVFAWLDGRSPLVTPERSTTSPSLIWTVHLERLGDEGFWSRAAAKAVVTH